MSNICQWPMCSRASAACVSCPVRCAHVTCFTAASAVLHAVCNPVMRGCVNLLGLPNNCLPMPSPGQYAVATEWRCRAVCLHIPDQLQLRAMLIRQLAALHRWWRVRSTSCSRTSLASMHCLLPCIVTIATSRWSDAGYHCEASRTYPTITHNLLCMTHQTDDVSGLGSP